MSRRNGNYYLNYNYYGMLDPNMRYNSVDTVTLMRQMGINAVYEGNDPNSAYYKAHQPERNAVVDGLNEFGDKFWSAVGYVESTVEKNLGRVDRIGNNLADGAENLSSFLANPIVDIAIAAVVVIVIVKVIK